MVKFFYKLRAGVNSARDALKYADRDYEGYEEMAVAHGDVMPFVRFNELDYPDPKSVRRAAKFVNRAKLWPRWYWKVFHLTQRLKTAAVCFWCELVGHDWFDDSYGGPDSGCMAGHCVRCGYSFHHTLY
jgi:hypothetical protein